MEGLTSKQMLQNLMNDHYAKAMREKEEGKLVCWATSICPQELLTTMDIATVYPENQAAAIGARKEALKFIDYAEGNGYSADTCSYARINLAYAELLQSDACNIPKPDLLFCCNNICNTVLKWYENLAKELNIPLIVFDPPFNSDYEITPEKTNYIKEQILDAITRLEEITKKKFDYDRFKEVMDISINTATWWKKATMLAVAKPSPLNGFDMFNYMAAAVCARGTTEGGEMFKKWYEELEEKAQNGEGPWKDQEEKYRVMWDGIACWPYLGDTYKILKKNGINMVTSTYPDGWYIVYEKNDLDGMAKAYSANYTNRTLEFGIKKIVDIVNDYSLDGIIYHTNRSCKLMDFRTLEVQRQVEKRTGVPSVMFDGDQTDPRAFSLAQYETRVQALVEIMEENKKRGRGDSND